MHSPMRRSVAILAFGVFVLTADTALSQTATSTDRFLSGSGEASARRIW